MRTTLTLDEDVAEFLKKESRLRNKPFKQVLNEAVRRAMTPGTKGVRMPKFKVTPNRSKLLAGIDPQRLNQLNDELEVAKFARKTVK